MLNTNKEEMNILLDFALGAAKFLLGKNGKFYPFAQALNNKNKIIPIINSNGNEHPAPQEVIDAYLPYETISSNKYEYGKLTATKGSQEVFISN